MGSGGRNGAETLAAVEGPGFRGSLRVVSEWATRRRRAERSADQQLQKVPSARTIARLMTTARDHLTKAETVTLAAIEAGVPMLVDARELIGRFHAMIRRRIGRTRTLDQGCQRQPDRLVRQRRRQG